MDLCLFLFACLSVEKTWLMAQHRPDPFLDVVVTLVDCVCARVCV